MFEIIKGDILISNPHISIGDGVFKGCVGLENISIGNSVSSVGNGLFEDCANLKTIQWGSKSETLPEDTFKGCESLANFNITVDSISSLKSIGDRGFKDCKSLREISGLGGGGLLFSGIESIGNNVFEGCIGMDVMQIPNTVSSLGDNVFEDCENLKAITVGTPPFEIGQKVLGDNAGGRYFYTGVVTDEEYNAFVEKWKEQLGEDYGEENVSKLIVRGDGNSTSVQPDSTVVPVVNKNTDLIPTTKPTAEPTTEPTTEPIVEETPAPTEKPDEPENDETIKSETVADTADAIIEIKEDTPFTDEENE